jgi:hypothetical protein
VHARELTPFVSVIPHNLKISEAFEVVYLIQNQSSSHCEELVAVVDGNEGFVFSGYKHLGFRLLPSQVYELRYNCWPLNAGRLRIPQLRLYSTKQTQRRLWGKSWRQQRNRSGLL